MGSSVSATSSRVLIDYSGVVYISTAITYQGML